MRKEEKGSCQKSILGLLRRLHLLIAEPPEQRCEVVV